MPEATIARKHVSGIVRKSPIPPDAPLYVLVGRERVEMLRSADAHRLLTDAGATRSHAIYRMKRAADQLLVRTVQLDSVRYLYAAPDVHELAQQLQAELQEREPG